jgi:hypothetical protein
MATFPVEYSVLWPLPTTSLIEKENFEKLLPAGTTEVFIRKNGSVDLPPVVVEEGTVFKVAMKDENSIHILVPVHGNWLLALDDPSKPGGKTMLLWNTETSQYDTVR